MTFTNLYNIPWTLTVNNDTIHGGLGNNMTYAINSIECADDGYVNCDLTNNAIAYVDSGVSAAADRISELEAKINESSNTVDQLVKLIQNLSTYSYVSAEDVGNALQELSKAITGAQTNENPENSNKKEDLEKVNGIVGKLNGIKISLNDNNASWLDDLGIPVYDDKYDIRPIDEVMEIVISCWNSLTPNQKYHMATLLAPEEPMKLYETLNEKRAAAGEPVGHLSECVNEPAEPIVDPAQISNSEIILEDFDFDTWLNNNIPNLII